MKTAPPSRLPTEHARPRQAAPAATSRCRSASRTARQTADDDRRARGLGVDQGRAGRGPARPGRELDEMRAAYDISLRDLNDLQQSGTDGAGDDQADAGSKTFEREQEQSIAANRIDLMTQIQRAVERIDAGTYGFCESCGKPIPKARLKAFPMATLDVACKQREERR